jgi:hypothetical protein
MTRAEQYRAIAAQCRHAATFVLPELRVRKLDEARTWDMLALQADANFPVGLRAERPSLKTHGAEQSRQPTFVRGRGLVSSDRIFGQDGEK